MRDSSTWASAAAAPASVAPGAVAIWRWFCTSRYCCR
ncbi:Uncharacterised protein [Bordetella pertussis]|nr:Uncharacterised protein [Bordetella pertussis]